MSDPVNLEVVRAERKETCPYCGKPEHAGPLLCPRIESITIYAGNQETDIHFWPDFDPDDPNVAA